ncbi:hypothetical protein POX_c03848 [Penicillium oxalicum]|uniref:Uncharacterized protein n=1 Tax=Penicillium oxalicum (strain 114-2 / CGMCC 5302) TaxID=933388 RepID=S8AUE0_PENO1|nr:hypothetical protein POX_c03848 [Penicillium oxalicum]EPS25462.1 hypothetical protein PDE_00395 [Penicillium oxalicum 114-2]KAI2790994.1 hypothetical protein POX_c03848 [Penicillium oxalicum]
MVIGLLLLTAIPTTTGVAFATSEQRKANQRREDARRMAKFHIDVECDGDTDDDRDVHGRRLVVRNDKVYIDHPNPADRSIPAFTALAFYIEYPELEETKHLERGLGLPTYVSADPPLLNWIYADVDTHELKYGNRSQSVTHIVGPWDWSENERVLTLEESNRFVAVEEEEGEWALYFDGDEDDCEAVLEEQGKLDKAFVPVKLVRKLAEEPPPGPR